MHYLQGKRPFLRKFTSDWHGICNTLYFLAQHQGGGPTCLNVEGQSSCSVVNDAIEEQKRAQLGQFCDWRADDRSAPVNCWPSVIANQKTFS